MALTYREPRCYTSIIGTPDPLPFGEKIVGVVMNRDGSVLDYIRNIE